LYGSTKLLVADILTLYKNSFLSNSNAVYNAKDCCSQIAAGALLRMLSYYYVKRPSISSLPH